jgi:transcription termination/antitermination protein NusG
MQDEQARYEPETDVNPTNQTDTFTTERDAAADPDVEASAYTDETVDVYNAADAAEASAETSEVADPVEPAAPVAEAGPPPTPAAEAVPDDEDDEDEDDEDEGPDLFLPGDWYVVHTYAGYENKVKANLASRISSMNMEDKIYDVVVPTEEVMELKQGKKQMVQRKVFPGYILVRMVLDDDSWYVVRNTPGVTGFVGPTGAKPTPLDHAEVAKILAPKDEERVRPRLEYEEGEVVSVISGAFAGMSGPISEINADQQTVKVLVDIFGRETPVTLPFDHVAKL